MIEEEIYEIRSSIDQFTQYAKSLSDLSLYNIVHDIRIFSKSYSIKLQELLEFFLTLLEKW